MPSPVRDSGGAAGNFTMLAQYSIRVVTPLGPRVHYATLGDSGLTYKRRTRKVVTPLIMH